MPTAHRPPLVHKKKPEKAITKPYTKKLQVLEQGHAQKTPPSKNRHKWNLHRQDIKYF